MSLVVILYLALLSVFTLGYLYKGVSLLKKDIDDTVRNRIRFALKAKDADDVDYLQFRKNNARLFIALGLLYMALLAVTFYFVPNLFTTLTVREIHLVRTCIIAALTLHFMRDLWMGAFRESFIKRVESEEVIKYDPKTIVAFLVLAGALIYSIYTQISYAW